MTDFSQDLEQCLKVLSEGGTILYPTDTVWGIGCDATNEAAVERIIQLKGKESTKGLIVLVASERDLLKHVASLDLSIFDQLEQRKEPTTVIYDGGTAVAENVLTPEGTIAIRIVKEDFCRHLIKRFRKPIVSTSANFHGSTTPRFYAEIDADLKKSVDYIVQYRQDDTQIRPPSSILKALPGGLWKVLR